MAHGVGGVTYDGRPFQHQRCKAGHNGLSDNFGLDHSLTILGLASSSASRPKFWPKFGLQAKPLDSFGMQAKILASTLPQGRKLCPAFDLI